MSLGDVMGLAALIIGLVAMLGIFSDIYKRRLAYLERKLEITAGAAAEKAAQYATHNSELENRVRVLERIITDEGTGRGVALEIEALRRPASASEVTTQ